MRKRVLILLVIIIILAGLTGLVWIWPSGDKVLCRKWYGKPGLNKQEIKIKDDASAGIRVLSFETEVCILDIPTVDNNTISFRIGLFDNLWRMHIYSVVAGGAMNEGRLVRLSACRLDETGLYNCQALELNEWAKEMKKGDIVILEIYYDYEGPDLWPGAGRVKNSKDWVAKLVEGLKGNGRLIDFPHEVSLEIGGMRKK